MNKKLKSYLCFCSIMGIMFKKGVHPGVILSSLLIKKDITQRDFASKVNIPYPLINNILKGSRNINVKFAISFEAAGYKTASFWLTKQMEYTLSIARNNSDLNKKKESIKLWDELASLVPLSYFKKDENLDFKTSNDIDKIFKVYNVKNIDQLESKIKSFNPVFFRKSSKFVEDKNNVIAWSSFAEYKVKDQEVEKFNPSNEELLISELKQCFLENQNVEQNTREILNKYGIKFLTLDRPPKTPVNGKSFISGKNPAIVLSLKYKRVDYFAFTIMHEVAHIFCHLTNPKFKKSVNEFYVDNSDQEIEEHEANTYAQNHLIDRTLWNDFISFNEEFTDDIIRSFAKRIKIHPAIVKGRVCYEFPEYYRKRSSINAENVLA